MFTIANVKVLITNPTKPIGVYRARNSTVSQLQNTYYILPFRSYRIRKPLIIITHPWNLGREVQLLEQFRRYSHTTNRLRLGEIETIGPCVVVVDISCAFDLLHVVFLGGRSALGWGRRHGKVRAAVDYLMRRRKKSDEWEEKAGR